MALSVGTLIVKLGVDSSDLDRLIPQLNRTAQRIRTFGYLASTALTLPLVAGGKAALNLAKDYEFSIQKMVGLAGVAQDQANQWSKAILEMAPRVAKGPKELADALYFIASSGIKGSRALDILEVSAKAATAGLGETKDVADLLTSVLNAYAKTGLTAAKSTDIIIAAVREGKGEADAFARSLGQVIPIAAQMGVSFDQVAGAAAAITLTGASAANAAVYLKGFFNVLLKEPPQGAKALDAVHSSYAKLRDMLKNPGGILKAMTTLTDAAKTQGDSFLSDVIPNIRGLLAVLSVVGKNLDYNSKLMQRVTNSGGSLATAFAAVSSTIKVQYDSALAKAQVLLIDFGKSLAETLLPMLLKLVKYLENVIKWFDSLSEAQKHNKIVWLLWIAALGPLSLLLSTVIYAVTGLISVLKGLYNTILWVGGAFKALRVLMVTNPVGLMIFAIAALATGYGILRNRIHQARLEQQGFGEDIKKSPFTQFLESKDVAMSAREDIALNQRMLFAMTDKQIQSQVTVIEQEIAALDEAALKLKIAREHWMETDLAWNNYQKKIELAKTEQKGWEAQFVPEADVQRRRWLDYEKKYQGLLKTLVENRNKLFDVSEQQINRERTIAEGQYKVAKEKFDQLQKLIDEQQQEIQKAIDDSNAITKAFQDLANGLRSIERQSQIFGNAFDVNEEKLKLFRKILEVLAETTIPLTDKRLQDLLGQYRRLFLEVDKNKEKKIELPLLDPGTFTDYEKLFFSSRHSYDQIAFMQKFAEELDLIALKESTLGDKFNATREQINYFKEVLNRLWDDAKMRPGDKLMDDLTKRMKELTLQAEVADILLAGFTRFFSATEDDMRNFANFFRSWLTDLLHAFQQMIAKMIAEKIVLKIFSGIVTGGTSAAFQAPNVVGAPTFGTTGRLPTDTFSALSLSGRVGTPMTDFAKAFATTKPEKVVFVIKENRLEGILTKADKRKSLI